MQVARDVVVASIQVDLDDAVLAQFREDLLRRLQESGCHGVILDVSGLDTLDAEEFAALRHVITMTRIMGARSVLAGLRPGVVSALIESGIDTDGLTTAVDLDAAFGLLLDASPAGIFERSARTAVLRWRFRPHMRGGRPVAARARYRINFGLAEQ